jgi:hypothetical protein
LSACLLACGSAGSASRTGGRLVGGVSVEGQTERVRAAVGLGLLGLAGIFYVLALLRTASRMKDAIETFGRNGVRPGVAVAWIIALAAAVILLRIGFSYR